jgi:hypothetical protein
MRIKVPGIEIKAAYLRGYADKTPSCGGFFQVIDFKNEKF